MNGLRRNKRSQELLWPGKKLSVFYKNLAATRMVFQQISEKGTENPKDWFKFINRSLLKILKRVSAVPNCDNEGSQNNLT